jgi:hypothetical protein
MKSGKTSRPLPGRGGLNDLTAKTKGGGANINDYSKVSPLTPTVEPATILNLGKKRRA